MSTQDGRIRARGGDRIRQEPRDLDDRERVADDPASRVVDAYAFLTAALGLTLLVAGLARADDVLLGLGVFFGLAGTAWGVLTEHGPQP